VKLVIKPKKGFGKIEVEIPQELVEKIVKLSEHYRVTKEKILEIAISENFKEPKGDLKALENSVEELKKKVGILEKEWAPLRYKAYGVSEDSELPRPSGRGFVRVHHCFTLTGRFTRPLPAIPLTGESPATLHTSPSRPSNHSAVTRLLYHTTLEYLNLPHHPYGRGLASNWEINFSPLNSVDF